jgi:hypothetical protein
MTIRERIDRWRADAQVLRRWGAEVGAMALERAAADLEEDVQRAGATIHVHDTDEDGKQLPELVPIGAAVGLSGYTRGHLRRMIVAGTLTNFGTDARPLLRAADLPRKPGYSPCRVRGDDSQRTQ